MIKPCTFPQATNFLPASIMDGDKKLVPAPFHYYGDPQGRFTVSCFELSEKDIEQIKATGKIWVTAPFKSFPPLNLQTENPFTPKMIIDEKTNSESARNDQQHNDGDHKLTIE